MDPKKLENIDSYREVLHFSFLPLMGLNKTWHAISIRACLCDQNQWYLTKLKFHLSKGHLSN